MSGTLPLDAVSVLEIKSSATSDDPARVGYARCQVDVSAAGKVKLQLNSAAGLSMWVDGVSVQPNDEVILDLKPGTHTITFAVDIIQRRSGLRCNLDDVPGSVAKVRIVAGK